MLGVLSKLAIAVALVVGPTLAVCCSAQNPGYEMALRQQGYLQPIDAEPIGPGYVDEGMADEGSYEDSGPLVGEFGQEWEDDNSCVTPLSGNSLDDGGESIFPDGVFNNRGPLWYSNVAFTMMQRSAPTHQGNALPVANLFEEEVDAAGVVHILRPLVMGTSGLDFHFTPGMRATLGRNLYEDILSRQHSIEFTFIGLNTWSTSGVAIGSGLIETENFLKLPGLFSKFPAMTAGGFNGASLMTMADSASFSNWELNYRIAKLPRPDRVSQLPDGTWMQISTPTLVHSLITGLRIFNYNDHFNWFSSGTHASGNNFTGVYNVKTANLLVGAQDWRRSHHESQHLANWHACQSRCLWKSGPTAFPGRSRRSRSRQFLGLGTGKRADDGVRRRPGLLRQVAIERARVFPRRLRLDLGRRRGQRRPAIAVQHEHHAGRCQEWRPGRAGRESRPRHLLVDRRGRSKSSPSRGSRNAPRGYSSAAMMTAAACPVEAWFKASAAPSSTLQGLAMHDIHGASRIGAIVVERRRDQVLLQSHHAHGEFDGSGPCSQISKEAFRRRDRNVSQDLPDHLRFGPIVVDGAQAMGVDVSYLARLELGGPQAVADRGLDRRPLERRAVHARLEAAGVTQHAPQDRYSAHSACRRLSKTIAAAPSPYTAPQRPASNGRIAVRRSFASRAVSHRIDRTYVVGWMRELVPPATITSASPRSMMLAASATADELETSAVASELLGPRASCVIAMWQAGMFGKYFNIHKGYNCTMACCTQSRKSNRPSFRQLR